MLTFIDDFNTYTTIYFLKEKSQVHEHVKFYKTLVENQLNEKIIAFRTDNGREYDNKNLRNFFRDNGIINQFTCACTPVQNGDAERRNRSIVEKARCMLADGNLPKQYWPEAAVIPGQ